MHIKGAQDNFAAHWNLFSYTDLTSYDFIIFPEFWESFIFFAFFNLPVIEKWIVSKLNNKPPTHEFFC